LPHFPYLSRSPTTTGRSEQTAQDYSIIVQDPDGHETDPDAWRDFFNKVFF
jgi:hypothetical protein